MKIIMNSAAISPVFSEPKNYPIAGNYTAILRVAFLCSAADLPYELTRSMDGWRIGFDNGQDTADIIENKGSYGSEKDLMESYGFTEDNHEEDEVTGYLSILKAIERIYNFFEK